MQRRSHASLTTKILKQPYYFKEWDYCRRCKHVQHYEEFKIFNSNEMSAYVQMIEEKQDIDSLFKNL